VKIHLLVLATALAAAGCARTLKTPPQPATGAGAATTQPAKPVATPITTLSGKVASVNHELRFVVIDFSVSGVPAEGRTMGVYRASQKVAQVKISGPVVGTNTAADILSGSVQVGDVVQED